MARQVGLLPQTPSGIRVAVITDPVSGRPLVLPIGTRHTDPAYA